MPELNTAEPVGGISAVVHASVAAAPPPPSSSRNGSANGNGRGQLRHVLEFEKPLAKIEEQIELLQAEQDARRVDYSKELRQLRSNYPSLLRKIYDTLSAWDPVRVARPPQRPLLKDYVALICREFRELHGDRH